MPRNPAPKNLHSSSDARVETPAGTFGARAKNGPSGPDRHDGLDFPVVGIGASAGGLEALTALLAHLPKDPGMAFVVISHMDPERESLMADILSRQCPMPVIAANEQMRLAVDHVYIIPPNVYLYLHGGRFSLRPRLKDGNMFLPIDAFFRSLWQDQHERAIAVVLSGTGSDGSLGLMEVKQEGGITFVQEPETAHFDAMPRHAIATGHADFILPAEEIARELLQLGRQASLLPGSAMARDEGLRPIFQLLSKRFKLDFTHYKRSTIQRRIRRRMVLSRINGFADYVEMLKGDSREQEQLYHDMLIKVTCFFRDPNLFEALKTHMLADLDQRAMDSPMRIWVPACATGEEVYSLAITLLELFDDRPEFPQIQLFGTDVSEPALEQARSGIYLENIALDVSPERLSRFFTRLTGGRYQISKSIRDLCIFARQDLIGDPPFSRLDLISCRNVMIYFDALLQRKVLSTFHYALKPEGLLILGSSETIGNQTDLFTLLDKHAKIYEKRGAHSRPAIGPIQRHPAEQRPVREDANQAAWTERDLQREADRIILTKYSPAGVIISENMEIIQFRGDISPLLQPAPGSASLNLLKMIRRELSLPIRALMDRLGKDMRAIRQEGLRCPVQDREILVNIEILPLTAPAHGVNYFLVLFEEAGQRQAAPEKIPERSPASHSPAETQIAQLQEELQVTKDYLQSVIEDYEAANEELKSASEEIQSSNEELQSTNEELETAKEELQSTNEELVTVNDELQHLNNELAQTNGDLINLLNNVNIPILILSRDLRIRRFTPMAERLLNLIPGDIGRPLGNLNANFVIPDLQRIILEVIDTLMPQQYEIQDTGGHAYIVRIRPYKTMDNRIDGATVVFLDLAGMGCASRFDAEEEGNSSPPTP